jgi:hypothetical protein
LQHNAVEPGRLSLGLNYEYEFLTDPLDGAREIPNVNRERTNNSAASLLVSYGLSKSFSVLAVFPHRTVTNEKILFRGQDKAQYDGGKYIRHASGWGDALLLLNYVLPQIKHLPAIQAGGGVKLANGSTEATDIYGRRFSDNLQIGSGSVDPVFALSLAQNVSRFVVSAGAFTRLSMRENIYGYKYGNELHAVLAVDYAGSGLFYAGLRLNYMFTTRDRYEYGKITRERGGKWIYLAPKLGFKILPSWDFEVNVPAAVYQNVNESQLTSSYQLQINTVYHLSL